MKINLTDRFSPCFMCDDGYLPNNDNCQRCGYNIAVQVLKKVLRENDYCACCKNRIRLGGGYYDCKVLDKDNERCVPEDHFRIDYDAVCNDYKIETI